MEVILNRLRGTGKIFSIFNYGINGNILYALYIVLVIWCAFTWYYGLIAAILYIIGESFAWGKWVGYLIQDNGNKDYYNKDGRSFPFIHYVGNYLIDQTKDYRNYCRLCLAIRGIVWWLPLYAFIGFLSSSTTIGIILGVVIGLLFPVAVEMSKIVSFKFSIWKIKCLGNWERQEIIYGLFQFICFNLLLI